MRNITVSVDEETHRVARLQAASLGVSVSALVRSYLRSLEPQGVGLSPAEQLGRTLARVDESMRRDGRVFHAADRLSRDALHDRGARRRDESDRRESDALR